MSDIIETSYPDNNQEPQCLITIPHSSRGGNMFDRFPQIKDAFKGREGLFQAYLNLEHDVGAQALAHNVGQRLEKDHGISTRVLFSHNMHHGIVDPNRIPGQAIRPALHYERYPGLRESLELTHQELIAEIRAALQRIPNLSRVVAIDLHTMAPYTPGVNPSSPTEAATLTPDGIEAYIQAFTSREFRGARRPIDILTTVSGQPQVGDPILAAALKNSLEQGGFRAEYNNPYPLSPVLMSTEIARQTRGLALDIPKDLVTQTGPDDEVDLTNAVNDNQKIDRLAVLIAAAIAETVRGSL